MSVKIVPFGSAEGAVLCPSESDGYLWLDKGNKELLSTKVANTKTEKLKERNVVKCKEQ